MHGYEIPAYVRGGAACRVHQRTIRNYLAAGLLRTERLPNGVHLFVEADIGRIREIRASRKAGRPAKEPGGA